MKGYCENCAKKETCTRSTGIIFGFCNIDFKPIQTKQNEEQNNKPTAERLNSAK